MPVVPYGVLCRFSLRWACFATTVIPVTTGSSQMRSVQTKLVTKRYITINTRDCSIVYLSTRSSMKQADRLLKRQETFIDQFMSVNLSNCCYNEMTWSSREANEQNTDVGALVFRVRFAVVPFMFYCVD